MRVLSVNVGLPRDYEYKGKPLRTAIVKEAVGGRVSVNKLGFEGDGVADTQHHGGPDKPIYAYPHEHYAKWAELLGRDGFAFGAFGENLTMEGLLESDIRIGDRYRVGSTLLEASQPRTPCHKLAMILDSSSFPKHFLESRLIGTYFRVVDEGDIGAGDAIERVSRGPEVALVGQVLAMRFFGEGSAEALKRVIALEALSEEWRGAIEKELAKREEK